VTPNAATSAEELVAFVHIPKTAGGTVTTMFNAAYSSEAVKNAGNYMSSAKRTTTKVKRGRVKGARVTVGHVPYGVYRDHLPHGTLYVTFLREPIDRVLSHYYRHLHRQNERAEKRRRNRVDKGKDEPGSRASSIEEALTELRMQPIRNLMTRFLCDDPTPAELPESALDDAKENLSRFAFVGIQERFDESLILLERRLDLPVVPYSKSRHVSVGGARPRPSEIPDEQRALIVEHNAMDAELYRYGVELFEQAAAEAGGDLEADVARVRELSATNGETDNSLNEAREWLERELPVGSKRPKGHLLAQAERDGIPPRDLKKVSLLLGVERDKRNWVRPPAAPG
jgi:hypothetical protein